MKHEKFKLFSVEDIEEDEEVKEFLNSGVTPKSVSVNYEAFTTGLVIGYTDDKAEHGYALKVGRAEFGLTATTKEVEEALNKAAADLNGVVCQDVTTVPHGLSIVFLITT